MELQGVKELLAEHGYALYAVSYDGVEVLSGFATKYGIDYPLLADEGSAVIRQLGILNEQANENVYGIPHPGIFVLDAAGFVRRKTFYPSYRERDTGAGLVRHLLGIEMAADGPSEIAGGAGVTVAASLDQRSYAWGQRVWLTVDFDIGPGLHVYGRPSPDGYYPVSIEVEAIDRVTVGDAEWPEPTPFEVEGLAEKFFVYAGSVSVSLPLSFLVVDAGRLEVRVVVTFQACTASECLMPETVRLTLPIDERPLIERPQPR